MSDAWVNQALGSVGVLIVLFVLFMAWVVLLFKKTMIALYLAAFSIWATGYLLESTSLREVGSTFFIIVILIGIPVQIVQYNKRKREEAKNVAANRQYIERRYREREYEPPPVSSEQALQDSPWPASPRGNRR